MGLFDGLWKSIVNIFGGAAEWFNENVIKPVSEFFTNLWRSVSEFAAAAWNAIVEVWNVVAGWFNDNIIQPVSQFFSGLWSGISTAASNAWTAIKNVWKVVKDWFNTNIVSPVKNAFSGAWSALKKGASDAWTGIKNVFKAIPEWFKSKFKDAWQKVKNVFSTGGKIFSGIKDGIVSAFKKVVNAIIAGINKVIAVPFNAINKVLDKIRSVEIVGLKPFKNLGSIKVPQIPLLAKGGVLKRGQVGLLEGNGAEAVVPLERNKQWIRAVANDLLEELRLGTGVNNSSNLTNSNVNNFTQIINAPKQPSRIELYRQTRNLLAYAHETGGV